MKEAGLLEDLNAEQIQAVTHGEGPLMIVAGAGTGKTTVITKRIAWLIETGKAKPEEILALTFTEKAATEMEERVDRLLPIGYLDLHISTFHAFCEKVLRRHGFHIGIPDNFSLYTEVDAWLLMHRNIQRFSLDYFRPRGNPTKFFQEMLKHFSRAKDEGITPEQYGAFVDELIADKSGGAREAFVSLSDEEKLDLQKWQELAGAYALYEQLLAEKSAIDFGGLLLSVLRLFLERPNVLAEYRKQFAYVVVDEFQDTNTIQYQLVKLLAEPRRNITVVGDDDQAIYKFRGAALANILQFRQDFPEATKVVLVNNYRSGKEILESAHTLIQANNPHRLEVTEGLSKKLRSQKDMDGFVHHLHAATLEDEVELVMKEIFAKKQAGAEWSDFAILARANDSVQPFLEAMEREGVPYQYVGLSGLYTKPIILDVLAYLRVIQESYHSPALYRILSHPRLGISERDLAEVMQYVRRKGVPIIEALRATQQTFGVSMEGRNRLTEITRQIEEERNLAKRLPIVELFVSVLKDTGLLGDIKMQTEAEQAETFRHLEGFLARVKRFTIANPEDKSLKAFLEELDIERESGEAGSVKTDPEEGPDVIRVMTVHGAKGLEFRYVFVVNLVEQRFPSVTRSEALPLPKGLIPSIPELDDHVAEERRLFYVAMTRAKEGLYLLSADSYGGTRKRKLSRFLSELGFSADSPQVVKTSFTDVQTKAAESEKNGQHPLPTRFSFSQIAAFTSCPLQYKYAHILRVPTFGRHTLSFGRSMHATFEKFMKEILERQRAVQSSLFGASESEGKIPALKVLLDLYEQEFVDEWYPSRETRDEYKEKGKEAVKVFYRQLVENPPTPYLLEAGFSCKVEDVLMKGRIDRIDKLEEGFEIIDYKTGTPKATIDWEGKRQLLLYAHAAKECFSPPLLVKKLSYYYVETNEKLSFEPTEKDLEKLKMQIVETVEKIRASDFPPSPSPFTCKYCDFRDICPFAEL